MTKNEFIKGAAISAFKDTRILASLERCEALLKKLEDFVAANRQDIPRKNEHFGRELALDTEDY